VPDEATGEKPPWRQRKETYIQHLAEVSPSVRLVSASDKLHNCRAIIADYRACGEDLWHRFSGGRETLWYYHALNDQFQSLTTENDPSGMRALLAEFDCAVQDLERLAAQN
jgi:GTP pyrophosphokinase